MKRGSILLAVLFTLAIPAMIAWPALRIAGSWTAGQESVRSSYGALRRLAINAINHPSGTNSDTWHRTALQAWNNDDRLLALVISDASGTVLYALPEKSPYYSESKPDTRGPQYRYPENTVARFNGAISSGLVLDALYITLRQGELYKPMRDATISLLILLALTASGLLAASASAPSTSTAETSARNTEESSEAKAQVQDSGAASATAELIPKEAAPPDDFNPEPTQEAMSEQGKASSSKEKDDFLERMEVSSPPDHIGFPPLGNKLEDSDLAEAIELLPLETSSADTEVLQVPAAGPLDGPRGLYDPETGLGWESYLRERLGAELRRSASFEQDLSILIASLDSSTGRTDPNYAVFAKTSRSFFSFNDLAFIFGSTGLAIILPNTDIDQAMRMSEELLKKLAMLIQDRSDPMSYLNLFMGLSSRSGRLVEADRLLGEAMAAHRKAREERDTHIMAFRPDPEKFRAYLANR